MFCVKLSVENFKTQLKIFYSNGNLRKYYTIQSFFCKEKKLVLTKELLEYKILLNKIIFYFGVLTKLTFDFSLRSKGL